MRFLAFLLGILFFCSIPNTISSQSIFAPSSEWVQHHRVAFFISKLANKTVLAGRSFEYAGLIIEQANKYNIDPYLIVALIMVESSFQNEATSHKNALGLMQVLPSTAKDVAIRNGLIWRGESLLFEPAYNIEIGTIYFSELITEFEGHIGLALTAYNQGPTRLRNLLRRQKNIPTEYAEKVQKFHRKMWDHEFALR